VYCTKSFFLGFVAGHYDFSGLQLTAVEFTHMQEQAMEEDHNSWIKVTKRKFTKRKFCYVRQLIKLDCWKLQVKQI